MPVTAGLFDDCSKAPLPRLTLILVQVSDTSATEAQRTEYELQALEIAAATKFQQAFRGFLARSDVRHAYHDVLAAKIGALEAFRSFLARNTNDDKIAAKMEIAAAMKLQQAFRCSMARHKYYGVLATKMEEVMEKGKGETREANATAQEPSANLPTRKASAGV